MAGKKREPHDTTKRGNGGATLKELSNDVIFSFFNDEKTTATVTEMFRIATEGARESDRINAIKEIWDRILGKAPQTLKNYFPSFEDGISDEKFYELLRKANVIKNTKPGEAGDNSQTVKGE